ncbi:hypothetical protein EYF80_010504 [Liparis tanakae]|uniref:Uncharacterized protein n=1 Tax=Liparis tanakae TaxID=230148 RepID=A0A4Z2IML8_9TELE|nr:hypothetical protein EYF80_010504 [Liparis tanakae]
MLLRNLAEQLLARKLGQVSQTEAQVGFQTGGKLGLEDQKVLRVPVGLPAFTLLGWRNIIYLFQCETFDVGALGQAGRFLNMSEMSDSAFSLKGELDMKEATAAEALVIVTAEEGEIEVGELPALFSLGDSPRAESPASLLQGDGVRNLLAPVNIEPYSLELCRYSWTVLKSDAGIVVSQADVFDNAAPCEVGLSRFKREGEFMEETEKKKKRESAAGSGKEGGEGETEGRKQRRGREGGKEEGREGGMKREREGGRKKKKKKKKIETKGTQPIALCSQEEKKNIFGEEKEHREEMARE